jgi:hypothetical protein
MLTIVMLAISFCFSTLAIILACRALRHGKDAEERIERAKTALDRIYGRRA